MKPRDDARRGSLTIQIPKEEKMQTSSSTEVDETVGMDGGAEAVVGREVEAAEDAAGKKLTRKERREAKKAAKMIGAQPIDKKHAFKLWLYVAPLLVLVFLFSYVPLFGWIYAFYDYQPPIPLSESKFVGLQWFEMMVQNPAQLRTIGQVLLNTFAMSGLNILTSFLPVIFAIALNEIRAKWFKNLIQTLTTLPNFISWVLVYSIAFAMFSSSGMVNELLMNMHLISEPIKFLDSPDQVWLKMLLWNLWKGLGWGSIMYLAGIAGIDPELYEAAQVDGANRFQQIIHVTIPQLMPTYFVLLMLSISNFLNNGMDQYYVFQNAFNQKWIQVLDLYVYNVGMGQNSLSLGTAISMLKSLVSVGLLLLVNWLSKRTRGVGIV
jgi:multiple sugar transport system permease protein/putative aldouronate transport system permease protein